LKENYKIERKGHLIFLTHKLKMELFKIDIDFTKFLNDDITYLTKNKLIDTTIDKLFIDSQVIAIKTENILKLHDKLVKYKTKELYFHNCDFSRLTVEATDTLPIKGKPVNLVAIVFANCFNTERIVFHLAHGKIWDDNLKYLFFSNERHNVNCVYLLEQLTNLLVSNYRIRDIYFKELEVEINKTDYFKEQYDRYSKIIKNIVERNNRGHETCQKACLTLLLLCKYRKRVFGKINDANAIKIIAKLLWKNRHKDIIWYNMID